MSLKNSEQSITLDLSYPILQNIRCVQNDVDSRLINITITDNSKLYKITEEHGVIFRQFKPDGNFVERRDIFTISNGTLEMILPEQSSTCVGLSKCQIEIVIPPNIIHTLCFNLVVEESVVTNEVVESKTDCDILDDMYKHLVDYNNPHKIPDASTTIKGITTLTDSTSSTSNTTAATPNSVKKTYDALVNSDNTIITNAEIDALFV